MNKVNNDIPLFTEHCMCGHRAIDHSLMWWLGDMVRLPDQQIVGPCGRCNDCRSFSYDGPPHESKLIGLRDYVNAPTMEEAEEIREVTSMLVESAGIHDHPLNFEEIAKKVDAELRAPLNFGAGIEGGLTPRVIEVKFPAVDVSRRLRITIEILPD